MLMNVSCYCKPCAKVNSNYDSQENIFYNLATQKFLKLTFKASL